jgi:dienelactone hydrolase
MKRWLAGAVTVEIILGGLAAAALSFVAPVDSAARGASRPAELTGSMGAVLERKSDGGGSEAGRGGSAGRRERHEPGSTGAPTLSAGGSVDSSASPERPQPVEKGISFRSPVDFATGASPSSAEFNKASGDQLALQLAHVALSDSVATGDFDRDGNTDVVQTNVLAGSLSIFLGDGRGGFASPVVRAVGVQPNFVVAGDLDLDGDLDLAVADTGANGVSILRGDGKGDFAMAGFLPVAAPRNIAIGRIDRGELPDLAIASAGPVCPRLAPHCTDKSPSAGGVHTFVGVVAGTFRPAQILPLAHSTDSRPVGANAVALHDFDGDRLDDLAVAVGTSPSAFDRAAGTTGPTGDDLLVFLNRGDAVLPFDLAPDQSAIRVGGSPDAIAVGDWDGDANPDLATLENGSGSITTLLGNERGHFRVKATNVSVGAVPRGLTVGDFDGDGIPDLVTASFAASTVSVLEGIGDGTFEPAVDHWVGDEPSSVAVGFFDGDRRLDLVAARMRTDRLSLLANDGQKRGDGVVVHRNIPYGSPTDPGDDPLAAHHNLDVYVPPEGTMPFAGPGNGYPVVFYAHGGGGIANNKTFHSYLMRSLAVRGIVAVSTNYRLGPQLEAAQDQDVAQAFRWTRDHIGSATFGGDARRMVTFGYSAGGRAMNKLATDPLWAEEQQHIRGLVLAGPGPAGLAPGAAEHLPESLLLSGDEGFELARGKSFDDYAAESERRGAKSTHVNVPARDHFTLVADLALATDPGRIALDAFLREHLDP